VPVELPLIASDANGDVLTYSAHGLPPGLTINPSTGLISGSLDHASRGVYPVVASATDGIVTHSQSFLWTVTHPNSTPALTPPDPQTHAEGMPVSLGVLATDPDDDQLTFGAAGLPPSLAIDAATGVISGILSFESAGTYPVTVTVSDGVLSTSSAFTWLVANTNRAPVMTNPGHLTHYARGEYAMAVIGDRPAVYWRLDETSGATAADSVGAHHGVVAGNLVTGGQGALADGTSAMLFDGSSAYIQAPATGLSLAGDLTIEAWVNLAVGVRQTLISKDYLREFELTVEPSGSLNLYQGNGSVGGNVQSVGGAVKSNVWQHVVVTRSVATHTIAF
jgi:hypothetical protein